MRSITPSEPVSGPSLLVVHSLDTTQIVERTIATALIVAAGIFVGAWTLSVSTHTAGRLDGAVDGEMCISREECLADDGVVEPLVGPGEVDSFDVTCLRTAATLIQAPCGQMSYEGRVPSDAAASVVVGDSSITSSSGGITYAAGERFGGNVRREYCRTTLDAGVTVQVRALCASAP